MKFLKMASARYMIMAAIMFLLASGCTTGTIPEQDTSGSGTTKKEALALADTTPGITGIGGIFFYSDDPEAVKSWYSTNLGLKTDAYGAVFEFRNANRPGEINYLRWSPFDKKSNYLDSSRSSFMINYRVRNIEGLVRKLKLNGVKVLDNIETYEYGKFVHVIDSEGNKIELWEPVDSVLTKMGGVTNK